MSTPDLSPTQRRTLVTGIVLVLLVVLLVVGLLLRAYAPGDMGNGFLVGAAMAGIVFLVAAVRVARAPTGATTVERALTQQGDERDVHVRTRSLAVLGVVTLPLTGAAAVALALGSPVAMTTGLLLMAQLAVVVIAFAVINRRG